MLKWTNKTGGRGDATTETLCNKLYLNITDNKKVIITVPEPLRKGANHSMITRDEDFLICHILFPKRRHNVGKHRATDGTCGETLIAELLRLHAFLNFMNTQQPGLREMSSCGTNWNYSGSYSLPSEPCSQTMWESLLCFHEYSSQT